LKERIPLAGRVTKICKYSRVRSTAGCLSCYGTIYPHCKNSSL